MHSHRATRRGWRARTPREADSPTGRAVPVAPRATVHAAETFRPAAGEVALSAIRCGIARDPIAIDCDASGSIEMTDAWDETTAVRFDLEGWGTNGRIQWLASNRDGWLCEDTDRDGKISSGKELFGTAGGFSDGFEKLSRRDADRNGVILRGALRDVVDQGFANIPSISDLKRSVTTPRLTFIVGVSSPPSTVRAAGMSTKTFAFS